MIINFKSKDLERVLTDRKLCKKQFGTLANVVASKLEYIRAASEFSHLHNLSGNFHALKYHAKGVYALTLKHPFRMILASMEDSMAITVIGIEDYHGHVRKMTNYKY